MVVRFPILWIVAVLARHVGSNPIDSEDKEDGKGHRLRHNNFRCFDDRPTLSDGYYEVLHANAKVIRAHCNTGFQLVGEALRLCDESKKSFHGADPLCKDIDECELMHNNSEDLEGSGSPFPPANDPTDDDGDIWSCHYQAECINTPGSYTCQCLDGYHGDGFHCYEGCSEPGIPENGYIIERYRGSFSHALYRCRTGYTLHGPPLRICTVNSWSGDVPRCMASDVDANTTWLAPVHHQGRNMGLGAWVCDDWLLVHSATLPHWRQIQLNQLEVSAGNQTMRAKKVVLHPWHGQWNNGLALIKMQPALTINHSVVEIGDAQGNGVQLNFIDENMSSGKAETEECGPNKDGFICVDKGVAGVLFVGPSSGGPLRLVGINSHAVPHVHLRLEYFRHWIISTTEACTL